MDSELYRAFNDEIHRYRRTLIYDAKRCEWDHFKDIAGRLFDYCESIEMTEIEKRFLRIFGIILAVLVFGVAFIARMGADPELLGVKRLIIFLSIAGSCFELYFFMNFRHYMEYKTVFYKKRRERFIRNIEQDFRDICISKCN